MVWLVTSGCGLGVPTTTERLADSRVLLAHCWNLMGHWSMPMLTSLLDAALLTKLDVPTDGEGCAGLGKQLHRARL